MYRLIALCFAALILSLGCFACIKIFLVFFVFFFYGGELFWVGGDTRFVLVNGTLLGLVFCAFAIVAFVRRK